MPATLAALDALVGLVRRRPMGRAQIEVQQGRRLRRLVRHAYERVPYYRKLFESVGLRPEQIRGLSDLKKIPLTSRRDIQNLPAQELCAEGVDPERLRKVMTSGSTGEPLAVRRRGIEEWLLLAYRARALFLRDLGPRARYAYIHSFSASLLNMLAERKLHERLGFLRRELIDCHLGKDEIVARLERFRPHVVGGPPSILSWIAEDLSDADRRRFRLERVRTGAEMLTPEMRETIECGFGAPVFDVYGSHEVLFIAAEAAGRPGYRVCQEIVICELLREGKPVDPGEEGEVVLTALHSYAAPFIRYRQGDTAVRGRGAEGAARSCSLLERIEGRLSDRFTLSTGRVVLAYSFSHELRGAPLRRFQIVQDRPDDFRIRAVLKDASALGEVERIAGKIAASLGEGVRVRVEPVGKLSVSRTGKFYLCVPYERIQAWGGSEPPG